MATDLPLWGGAYQTQRNGKGVAKARMPDLATARSDDGLQLEGLYWDAPGREAGFILIHGFASRFYAQVVGRVAEGLAARGHPAVSGNTRGHDYGTFVVQADGTTRLQGSAWEDPSEGPLDVAGWVAWLEQRAAPRRMILVGHSLGAWKVALHQAERHDPRVAGLVLMSPPMRGAAPGPAADLVELARRMVAEGRGDELLPSAAGRTGRLSARSLAARASGNWPSDLGALLARAGVPVLVTYGDKEHEAEARLAALAHLEPAVTRRLIPGGDHNYSGRWDQLAGSIVEWLADRRD
jgi:pimeloyl-ACP methyl ester carboxylesterase